VPQVQVLAAGISALIAHACTRPLSRAREGERPGKVAGMPISGPFGRYTADKSLQSAGLADILADKWPINLRFSLL
jgi:hypothetical protein